MWQMIQFIEFAKCQLDAADPDVSRLAQSRFDGGTLLSWDLVGAQADFQFFGLLERHSKIALHSMRIGPSADAEHLGSLHSPIINNGYIGGAAANVHQNGAQILIGIIADYSPCHGER